MRAFHAGLVLLVAVAALVGALAIRLIANEWNPGSLLLGLGGLSLAVVGGYFLRIQLRAGMTRRRGEIALFAVGACAVLVVIGAFASRVPLRFDLTTQGSHSLSQQTADMLSRLSAPVHITFFYDSALRTTVELYELFADATPQVTVEFHNPNLNPAAARLAGVQFAGTAVLESEGRRHFVHGSTETDIANGVLRVSLGVKQKICFLDGHVEADPFSLESHDHQEGAPGHSHGLGAKFVLHERHGMAKARNALETINYEVVKVTLAGATETLEPCSVLVVAGPKTGLLQGEVEAIRAWLEEGNNAFFMLDPFVDTGLEPLLRDWGIVAMDAIVIDDARYFWADVSTPTVTSYNHHKITRDLALTFYPGVRPFAPTPERVPGTAVIAAVNSSPAAWAETDQIRAERDPEEQTGPLTLVAISSRRLGDVTEETDALRSRIVVAGDADFAQNSFFHLLGNGNLFLNIVNYLAEQENLIGLEPRSYDLPEINMTNRQMKGTFFFAVVLWPALLALAGTVIWWRRR
jgi:ABC-type uncharacterized transport system involved in gliding motility auxiliary subunit